MIDITHRTKRIFDNLSFSVIFLSIRYNGITSKWYCSKKLFPHRRSEVRNVVQNEALIMYVSMLVPEKCVQSGKKFPQLNMIGRTILTRSRLNLAALSGSAALIGKYKASERLTSCSEFSTTPASSNITLYEYKICPFCNKVKAYLDFLELDYTSVEVNPLTKREINFQKEITKVPVATLSGVTIGESADIINNITERLSA